MKQQGLGLGQSTKRTRRREFLGEMERVVPWSELVALVSPYLPEGRRGRPPFPVEAMLRIHFTQQWFNLSDPSMEEALHDVPLFRDAVDAHSGLVHTVRGTAGSVNDVVEANALLHGDETDVYADAGYQGAAKRPDAQEGVNWHIAMRPGRRKALDLNDPIQELTDDIERIKARILAKVEHPFRVIKRQFGHVKVRYRGLAKNTAQLHTLFALSNLWMAKRRLQGSVA